MGIIADAASSTEVIAVVIGIIVFLVGVGGAIFVQSRTTGMTETISVTTEANGELRAIIADQKAEKLESDLEHQKEMSDLVIKHTAEVTLLQGKIEALTGDIADKLVKAAVEAAQKTAGGTA